MAAKAAPKKKKAAPKKKKASTSFQKIQDLESCIQNLKTNIRDVAKERDDALQRYQTADQESRRERANSRKLTAELKSVKEKLEQAKKQPNQEDPDSKKKVITDPSEIPQRTEAPSDTNQESSPATDIHLWKIGQWIGGGVLALLLLVGSILGVLWLASYMTSTANQEVSEEHTIDDSPRPEPEPLEYDEFERRHQKRLERLEALLEETNEFLPPRPEAQPEISSSS